MGRLCSERQTPNSCGLRLWLSRSQRLNRCMVTRTSAFVTQRWRVLSKTPYKFSRMRSRNLLDSGRLKEHAQVVIRGLWIKRDQVNEAWLHYDLFLFLMVLREPRNEGEKSSMTMWWTGEPSGDVGRCRYVFCSNCFALNHSHSSDSNKKNQDIKR